MKFTSAVLLGLASASDIEYMSYLTRFGKTYGTKEEFDFRKAIYEENMAKIQAHNAANASEFTMGENHMTDWTDFEFKRLLGFRPEED